MTEWIDISVLELYQVLKDDESSGLKIDEEETCSICLCELYDGIHKMTSDQI